MKASHATAAIFVAAAIGLLGVIAISQPKIVPRPLHERMTGSLRLNGPFDPSYAGEMVAARTGLFAQEDFQIQLNPGSPESNPIATVASGKDTIGVTNAYQLLLERSSGVPLVAFAAAYLESPVVFYSLRRSGIRAPSDFAGRRIGYQTRQDTALMYEAMMEKLQLPRSGVHEVATGFDLSLLVNGTVDVLPGHVGVESYALHRQNIDYNQIRPASYGLHVPGTVYFATESTIQNDPSLVRQFLRAVLRGWELAYEDYSKSIPLIASFDAARLAPGLIRLSLDQQREYLRPFGARYGEFDKESWRSLQDILLQQRLLKEPLDLSRAATFDFLRDAYRRPILGQN